jgi:hypothetical protein
MSCTLRGYDIVNGNIEYSGPAVVMDDVTISGSGLIRSTETITSPSLSSTDPTVGIAVGIAVGMCTLILAAIIGILTLILV